MIVTKGHEALYTICDDVKHGLDVKDLCAEMMAQMIKHNGCGLAANQISVTKRVIALSVPNYTGIIINPIITNHVTTEKLSSEGCLSVPNKRVKVKRFTKVVVEGFDENWNKIKVNMKQLSAFCVQHEIDHLNGITI